MLGADQAAGPQQPGGPAARATRIASSPSSPDHSARCGSWSRASGATDSQASSGMYGGLQVTTSTVPARSSNAVGQVTRAAGRRRCRRGCARPTAWARRVELDGVDPGASGTSSATALAIAPSRCTGRRPPGRSSVRGARVDRPAGEQLGLRPRHEHPGPDGQLDVAEVGDARSGAAAARGRPGARPGRRSRGTGRAARRRPARRRAAVDAEHVGEQLGGVVLAGRRRRPRRGQPDAVRAAARHGRGDRLTVLESCLERPRRRPRSASTHESRTGSRSPSSTWSRL